MASDGSEAFPFLRNVLPGIGCCLYGAACTYDNSPDEDFIIDTLPAHDNTLLITGLSGHGFKFASVLGEMAADFAQDKKAILIWRHSGFPASNNHHYGLQNEAVLQEYLMRRLVNYLINNIREHLMLYLFLWGLLAIMDLNYVFYF